MTEKGKRMILLIDEFDNHSQVAEIDPDIIQAIKDGVMSAFRFRAFQFPSSSSVFQEHNGDDWVDVPFGPS